MAQTCAICGAEINLVQQQKLIDGNYICRKNCKKLGMKELDYVHSGLQTVIAHNKQVEEGAKLFERYFLMPNKSKKKKNVKQIGPVYIAEEVGLMALAHPEYKFFVFGKYYPKACVYRIADLFSYEEEKLQPQFTTQDQPQSKKGVHYVFNNVEGLSDFFAEDNTPKKTKEYFDRLFGIQKTIGNMANTWKNQINASKAIAAGIGAAVNGSDDAAQKVDDMANAIDVMKFGDRTEWIRKADEALVAFRAGQ